MIESNKLLSGTLEATLTTTDSEVFSDALNSAAEQLSEGTPDPSSPNKFQCDRCLGFFVSYKGLKQHIGKKHNLKNKYSKCPQCDKRFRTKYAVRFHLKQVHQKLTRVHCDTCGIELYNKYALRVHVKAYHLN